MQFNIRQAIIQASNDPLNADFEGLTEYFIYTPHSYQKNHMDLLSYRSTKDVVKFSKDAVAYCTSGLVDRNKQTVLSYLQKAIKSLNQLRMIEDSLVIYRLSSSQKEEYFILMLVIYQRQRQNNIFVKLARYRNKLTYDANTGEIRDDKKYMSMMEDFWYQEGGRGTEISTLSDKT